MAAEAFYVMSKILLLKHSDGRLALLRLEGARGHE
jgi:hypothetical protein